MIWSRLRAAASRLPFLSRRWDDDRLEEELRLHLDMLVERGRARGLSHDEAVRAARRRLGGIDVIKEQYRDQRSLPMIETMRQDVLYALRSFRRTPTFTAVCIVTLALGIGATSAIFSVVRGVLLRSLPYPEPERLVRIFETNPRTPRFPVSPLNLLDYEEETRAFEALGGYTGEDLQLGEGGRPEWLTGLQVTPGYFSAIGVRPALGRNFEPRELRDGSRVLILSHDFWTRRFGSDPGIIGRSLRLSGEAWTVVGVMPDGFEHVGGDYRSPPHGETVDVWWPLDVDPARVRRFWHYVNVVGRLKPGVGLSQASADLERVAEQLEQRYPESNQGWRAFATSLRGEIVGASETLVEILFAAVLVALLIACANVSGLLLARGAARHAEIAMRMALGASRRRLVGQAMTESLVLALCGGVVGLALASVGVRLLTAGIPADFPRVHSVSLDRFVVLFTLAACVLSAAIFGVVPAFQQTSDRPSSRLVHGHRLSADPGTLRLRSWLVTAQIALAFALLLSAGLLLRSFVTLQHTAGGFDARGTLTFTVSVPSVTYPDDEAVASFYARLHGRLRRLAGVEVAGAATALPWTGWDENSGFEIVGRETVEGPSPNGRYNAATPGYFEAVRMPLLAGRFFDDRDAAGAPYVVIVNDSLARKYLPGEDPLGQVLDVWGEQRTIVGVVGDVRDRPEDADAVPAYYFPQAQRPFNRLAFALRTRVAPLSLVDDVRAAVRSLDAELPITDVRLLEDVAGLAYAQRRFLLMLVLTFAVCSVVLCAVGVYGVLNYSVQLRRGELGIRLALGATGSQVRRLVLRHGLRAVLMGLSVGAVLAAGAGRFIQSMLYRVSPADPLSIAGAAAVIVAVALTAAFIPARRAGVTDPARVLRLE